MLADLRRIRDLQLLQRQALIDPDGARVDRLEALDAERVAVQSRLVPLADAGLSPAERDEAERLVDEIRTEQDALIEVAERVRQRVAEELRTVMNGKSALGGYRAPSTGTSLYLDRAS